MLENLIELAKNEIPITMSSLVNTIFDSPDKILKRIKAGFFSYAGTTETNYKFSIMCFTLNTNHYILFLTNCNSKKEEKVVKLNDQIIIIKIKTLDCYREIITDIYTNYKYID